MGHQGGRRISGRMIGAGVIAAAVFAAGAACGGALSGDHDQARIEACLPIQTATQLAECLR
ncbi:hypothetical protein [Gordonia alkaliphila]|uniref:Uncharacterized protein n=1 Tax=Gordonia alkaliphila TaxID=1053547 RepID=A0ABP8YZY2_9ACTN